jgi:membrane protein implicated in regulation of membrane protease activity
MSSPGSILGAALALAFGAALTLATALGFGAALTVGATFGALASAALQLAWAYTNKQTNNKSEKNKQPSKQ